MSVMTGFAGVIGLLLLLALRVPIALALMAVSFVGVAWEIGLTPAIGAQQPRPSASRLGRRRPWTARATFPSVLLPPSPYASVSGAGPTPTPSSTMIAARRVTGAEQSSRSGSGVR